MVAAFSMFLCLLDEVVSYAIYFTANGSRKLIDGSILTIFPHKELKEKWEKRLQHRCFRVNFAEILRTPSFRNTSGGCF